MLAYKLPRDIESVISTGLFDMSRQELIATMEQLVNSLWTTVLRKCTNDYFGLIKELNGEYQKIEETLTKVPENTEQLMFAIEYASETETDTILALEDQLRELCSRFVYLVDFSNLSVLEMKNNNLAFQQYVFRFVTSLIARLHEKNLKISLNCSYMEIYTVIVNFKTMADEKAEQFKELLERKINQFNSDLNYYSEKVDSLQDLGDFNDIEKYHIKAQKIDNKYALKIL